MRSLFPLIILFLGCNQKEHNVQSIQKINECYSRNLNRVQKTPLYQTIHAEFIDTFQSLKRNKENFGDSNIENHIDEALFLNTNKTEALLIILERSKQKNVFGSSRLIHAKINGSRWVFKIGSLSMYNKDYFDLFESNSFENISLLARYTFITEGNTFRNGCDFNEKYWFNQFIE